MNKLAIVHNSDIIRKGLTAIIKSYFNLEVFQFSTIGELKDYTELFTNLRILLIDGEKKSDFVFYKKIREEKKIRVICLLNRQDNENQIEAFDSTISIFDSPITIHEIVSKYLKSDIKEIPEQEGEELTQREKDVLKLVALGNANKEIADKLFISIHTVISHRKNITEKLGIKSISGLTVYAILNKLIDTDNLIPENLI